MDSKCYNTDDLKKHVNEVYARVKPVTEEDGVYMPLNINFGNVLPLKKEGKHCFAENGAYHYCYTERGNIDIHKTTRDLFEITYCHRATNFLYGM